LVCMAWNFASGRCAWRRIHRRTAIPGGYIAGGKLCRFIAPGYWNSFPSRLIFLPWLLCCLRLCINKSAVLKSTALETLV
jgi:hypothetical protein